MKGWAPPIVPVVVLGGILLLSNCHQPVSTSGGAATRQDSQTALVSVPPSPRPVPSASPANLDTASQSELIVNGGFEDGRNAPWHWQAPVNIGDTRTTEVKRSGEASLRIQVLPQARLPLVTFQWTSKVKPGTTYAFSAFVKTEDLDGEVWFMVSVAYGDTLEKENFSMQPLMHTNDWTELHMDIPTRPDARQVGVELRFEKGSAKQGAHGTFWADDLSLREKP